MDITFSPGQEKEIKKIINWYRTKSGRQPYYYLAGFAGSGKSTLAKYIAKEVNARVGFAAYTGKAALVMRKNGCIGASTIHSKIYKPVVDKKTGKVSFTLNRESEVSELDLLIIDECSMVNDDLGNDLLSYGTPILVLGDPGQLPPIKGAGYFTSGKPDGMLTEIHRQAADNPIIRLATQVRNGEYLQLGQYGSSKVTDKLKKNEVYGSDQFICGMNSTRIGMNHKFRSHKGFEGIYPVKGERLICLKNDKDYGMLNGELYDVTANTIDEGMRHHIKISVESVDTDVGNQIVPALRYTFDTNIPEPEWKSKKDKVEMTFGYALTAHKSQGSQWDNVYVYDESDVFRDNKWRWLYTAITRASESVIIYI